MKKNILFLLLGLFLFSNSVFSSNAELFSYDESAMQNEFSELVVLENYVLQNEGTTYTELSIQQPQLVSSLNLSCPSPLNMAFGIGDMKWGAFAWGLLCCPVGFFLVILDDDEDSDSKISFWIGVACSAILSTVSGGVGYR